MNKIYTTLFLLLACWATLAAQKTIDIPYLQEYPQLDGQITDTCWSSVPEISDFITATPVFNEAPATETKVNIFRTEEAIYVSVYCFSKKVRADRSFRDDLGTGDYFQVGFDTWHDGQHAFVFGITAGNAQSESRISATGDDPDWDAIWESKATLHDDGWSAEMRIPYEALRFPRGAQRDWGIQFTRFDRKTGYVSTWSPQNPLIGDLVLQYGVLRSMGEVNQGLRVSMELQNEATQFRKDSIYKIIYANVSIDLKVGINSASTLDLSILPSYGGEYSNFLGIQQFEYRRDGAFFTRNRQFFEEERFLFDEPHFTSFNQTSGVNFWYDLPPNLQSIVREFYDGHPLVNMKYTTRTKNNVGFGVYSSIIGEAGGIHPVTRQHIMLKPKSNYSFFTYGKALKNNSFVNMSSSLRFLQNSSVTNYSNLSFRLRSKNNRYEISGNGLLQPEQVFFNNQVKYFLQVSKVNGGWCWAIKNDNTISAYPILLINRLTPVTYSAYRSASAELSYKSFKQKKQLLNEQYFVRISQFFLSEYEEKNASYVEFGASILDRRFQTWKVSGVGKMTRSKYRILNFNNDTAKLIAYKYLSLNVSFQSDRRKKLTYGLDLNGLIEEKSSNPILNASSSINWVIDKKSNLAFSYNHLTKGDIQWNNKIGWYYIRTNRTTNSFRFNYEYMPFSRFRISVSAEHSLIESVEKYFNLLPSGNLLPVEGVADQESKSRSFGFGGSLSYVFFGVCRLSLSHGQRNSYEEAIFPRINSVGDLYNGYGLTNLSLIWFTGLKKQKRILKM